MELKTRRILWGICILWLTCAGILSMFSEWPLWGLLMFSAPLLIVAVFLFPER